MTHIKASPFFSRRCLHSFFSIHLELLLRLHPYYGIPVLSYFLKTASSQFQQERKTESEIGFEWLQYLGLHDAFSFLFFLLLLPRLCIPWTGDPVVLSAQALGLRQDVLQKGARSGSCIPAMVAHVPCLVCKWEFEQNYADLITST